MEGMNQHHKVILCLHACVMTNGPDTHTSYTYIDKISWIKPIDTPETLQLYNVYTNENIFVHDKEC